ncbi:MAG: HEAT repeat domain-containing protein [Deltaproteobacteria bacterium]|nr:HEAT repeat domain-containing protein [Deltaproteobacteria bacterium]
MSADVRRRLRDEHVPLETLGGWLASSDAAIAHAAVQGLVTRWRDEGFDPATPAIAAIDAAALAPETSILVADLALEGVGVAVPTLDPLPPLVRVAWLRVALVRATTSAEVDALVRTAAGREALRQLPVEVGGLVGRLTTSIEAGRRSAVELIDRGLACGLHAPPDAQRWLLGVIASSAVATTIAALNLLGEPWASALPLPPIVLGEAARTTEVELARLAVMRRRGDRAALRRELIELDDAELDLAEARSARRGACVRALGDLGDDDDLTAIVDRVTRHPDELAAPAIDALIALKRRGHGPDDAQTRRLFALYLDTPHLAPGPVAEIVSSRGEVVVATVDAAVHDDPDGDPDWERVVALLEALGSERACARLLAMVGDERERAGWWAAIAALGRLDRTEAEGAILERLTAEPEAALQALALIGGDATVEALRVALALAVPAATRPPWAATAATVLLRLDASIETLDDLHAAGLLDAGALAALPAHGAVSSALALRAIAATAGHPLRTAAIHALGRSGNPRAITALATAMTDPDDAVRSEVHAALRTLGVRLAELRAPRPRGLEGAQDPGATAIAIAAIARLRERHLDDDALARLLDAIHGHAHAELLVRVRPLLRHRNPELRKRACAVLIGAGAPAVAWLTPRLGDDELPVVRQALIALGELRATSATAAIAACLASPNMNLKKTAAEALARAGSPAAVPALLAWIAHHDNPGLRELVRAALRAILGRWLVPVVIAALDQPREPRAIELLVDALDGALTADQVAALAVARPTAPWIDALLRSAGAGTLGLAAGPPIDLDAAFTRRGRAAALAIATAPRPDDDEPTRLGLVRLAGARDRRALGRALRTVASDDGVLAALLARRRIADARLTGVESQALLDRWDALDDDARTAALALLPTDDATLTARIAQVIAGRPPTDLPPGLGAVAAARWTSDAARWWSTTPWPEPEATRARAATVVRLDHDRAPPATISVATAVELARDLIDAGEVDRAIALGTRDELVRPIVAAIAAARGIDAAIRHAEQWRERAPGRADALVHALTALGAPAIAALRRLARDPRVEVRTRARLIDMIAAIDRDSPAARAFLDGTVDAAHAAMAPAAATALLGSARLVERRQLLARFLDGKLGGPLAATLGRRDTAWLAAELRASTGERRERGLMLLGSLDDVHQRDALALEVWRATDDDAPAKDRARALLRGAPVGRLWPRLEPALARGDWTVLDVLGPTAVVPPSLIAQLAARPDQVAHWAAYLDRATAGTLVAPGLAEALIRGLASATGATARDHLLRVIARLVDWAEPDGATALAAALAPLLAGTDRDDTLTTILVAIGARDPAARLDLLLPITRPADRDAVLAIADAVLAAPRAALRLSPAIATAVERVFAAQLGGRDPDRLLDDADPSIVRTAIRIVAFAGDREAVDALAALLAHAHVAVRAAARGGLLTLGPIARPALVGALAHARPDRRAVIAAVLDDLDNAIDADEPGDAS